MENKITDLEIRLTHQEAAIEEINSVLLKQHRQIESLIADFALLQKQLRDMSENLIADQSLETPPPHY
ncbi:SlyX family protein [Kaarinaea lacus]